MSNIEERIEAQKAVVDGLITAAENKTGVSFENLPEAVNELIDGYGAEDPAIAAFIAKINEYSGESYTEFADAATKAEENFCFIRPPVSHSEKTIHYVTNMVVEGSLSSYKSCSHLKTFTALTATSGGAGWTFDSCNNLRELSLPKFQNLGPYYFACVCPNLEKVTIGSVGNPFTNTSPHSTSFANSGSNVSSLEITIYVKDDAVLPLGNQPWGAKNATIIYRSATTGEVIPVE